jgi:hypothetical protein
MTGEINKAVSLNSIMIICIVKALPVMLPAGGQEGDGWPLLKGSR